MISLESPWFQLQARKPTNHTRNTTLKTENMFKQHTHMRATARQGTCYWFILEFDGCVKCALFLHSFIWCCCKTKITSNLAAKAASTPVDMSDVNVYTYIYIYTQFCSQCVLAFFVGHMCCSWYVYLKNVFDMCNVNNCIFQSYNLIACLLCSCIFHTRLRYLSPVDCTWNRSIKISLSWARCSRQG